MVNAAGELPDDPAVDSPEREPTPPAGLVQQPFELGRREVRVGDEARAPADQVGGELGAAGGGAAVLPDDRAVDGAPGRALPEQSRLALIRDPDRGEIAGGKVCIRERGRRSLLDALPELLRIVLDPAGTGGLLAQPGVAAPLHGELRVDDQTGRTGGALVDRES